MALADLVRSAVAIAQQVTKGLQVDVVHRAVQKDASGNVVTTDAYGTLAYHDPVTRHPLWEDTQRLVRGSGGTEQLSTARLTFLEPVDIDERDELTLPDGHIAQIAAVEGLRSADGPFLQVVWLGRR